MQQIALASIKPKRRLAVCMAALLGMFLQPACSDEEQCCPIDYYLCNGGRLGGTKPHGGMCHVSFDQYYESRVITKDQNGCPMIDVTKSVLKSCISSDTMSVAPVDAQD